MNRFPFSTVVLSLFFLAAFALQAAPSSAQTTDPFGPPAKTGNADPFGGNADPFGDRSTKRPSKAATQRAPAGKPSPKKTMSLKEVVQRGKPIELTGIVHDAADAKIKAALDHESSQTFIDVPLREAMQHLSETHDIPIVIDLRALEEIGLDQDVGVNIDLKNVSLRSFLRLMLRDLDLSYQIKDQVMQITTKEAAENNLVIEIYRIPDNLAKKTPQIMNIIQSNIVPDTWEKLGGASVISDLDHLLIVSTTTDTHQQIETFLNQLVSQYGK